MLRTQSTTMQSTLDVRSVQRCDSERAMRPSFLAFLGTFDPARFRRDAVYRHRVDQALQTFSEREATIFCRIYLKLLAH